MSRLMCIIIYKFGTIWYTSYLHIHSIMNMIIMLHRGKVRLVPVIVSSPITENLMQDAIK